MRSNSACSATERLFATPFEELSSAANLTDVDDKTPKVAIVVLPSADTLRLNVPFCAAVSH